MSGNRIKIRPAAAENVEKVWPLVQDFAFSYEPERSAFEPSFSELLDRSDTLVLVAVTNTGAIVGYLLGSYHEPSSPTAPSPGSKNSWSTRPAGTGA
jgi:hypothetical protein